MDSRCDAGGLRCYFCGKSAGLDLDVDPGAGALLWRKVDEHFTNAAPRKSRPLGAIVCLLAPLAGNGCASLFRQKLGSHSAGLRMDHRDIENVTWCNDLVARSPVGRSRPPVSYCLGWDGWDGLPPPLWISPSAFALLARTWHQCQANNAVPWSRHLAQPILGRELECRLH